MDPFAIYFPQFYPTDVNNKAWGYGFTDWALLANANLRNSWQRRAPIKGFYDGSDPVVHSKQINELKESKIKGFAVYHYWFYSSHELNSFERTLLSSQHDDAVPWFLIWATESWSKRWIADPEILLDLSKTPSKQQIDVHCDYLVRCFENPNYLRWRNKPLFVWYNLAHFDSPEWLVDKYRDAFLKRGFDVAMAHFVKNPFDLEYCKFLDASYFFEPRLFFGSASSLRGVRAKKLLDYISKNFGENYLQIALLILDRFSKPGMKHTRESFMQYIDSPLRANWATMTNHPCQDVLSPGWNNFPRYGNRFTSLESLEPNMFAKLLSKSMMKSDLPPLINAWNEWTEGAAIEPCVYLSDSYLDAISSVIDN